LGILDCGVNIPRKLCLLKLSLALLYLSSWIQSQLQLSYTQILPTCAAGSRIKRPVEQAMNLSGRQRPKKEAILDKKMCLSQQIILI
jgi:hypothetical protein